MYASRRKAELLDDKTYSLSEYEECVHLRVRLMYRAERVLQQWNELEESTVAIHNQLRGAAQTAFEELLMTTVKLNANLNRMYMSGKLLRYPC